MTAQMWAIVAIVLAGGLWAVIAGPYPKLNPGPRLDPQVYFAAADLIERDGWWGGEARGYGTNCALIALAKVAPGELDDYTTHFAEFVKTPGYGSSLPTWNDAQPSADVVIDAFRRCGEALEGKR